MEPCLHHGLYISCMLCLFCASQFRLGYTGVATPKSPLCPRPSLLMEHRNWDILQYDMRRWISGSKAGGLWSKEAHNRQMRKELPLYIKPFLCFVCARCVQGDWAAWSAAAEWWAASSQTAGPAESPTEQVLCRYPRGKDEVILTWFSVDVLF